MYNQQMGDLGNNFIPPSGDYMFFEVSGPRIVNSFGIVILYHNGKEWRPIAELEEKERRNMAWLKRQLDECK